MCILFLTSLTVLFLFFLGFVHSEYWYKNSLWCWSDKQWICLLKACFIARISGLSAAREEALSIENIFVRIYREFTSFFFSWKELHFKQREEGNLLLYGYHQWDEDEKLQEIIFLLVFALSWCYQPSVWVPCSHSPIFQVTATPPKAGQWHRGLPVATDLPLPLDLTTFNLLTMHILPSSLCYCRSTLPFFTFAGQILCIPLFPLRSFDFIPWYPTVLTAVQFMHRHYMERHTNNENRSTVGRKCPKSPPWNGTTQLIPCILTVNNMEAHVGTCWCKWIGYSEQ